MKLSVIIPVYNEPDTILKVVERVRNCGVQDLDIVIVDDGSSDTTPAKLQDISNGDRVTILRHNVNRGKSAAIRTAQPHVSGDAVVVQDADLEYVPEELPRLVEPIEQDRADVVYGSRYSGTEILVDSFWHYAANKMLTLFSNMLANIHLTDMETCYKVIRRDIFQSITIESDRFGIEPELTAKLAKRNCRIYEVPISYNARRRTEGKKIKWQDGLAALWFIIKFNLFR